MFRRFTRDQLGDFEAKAIARAITAAAFAHIERCLLARIDELRTATLAGVPDDRYEKIRDHVGGIAALAAEGRSVELLETVRARPGVRVYPVPAGRRASTEV